MTQVKKTASKYPTHSIYFTTTCSMKISLVLCCAALFGFASAVNVKECPADEPSSQDRQIAQLSSDVGQLLAIFQNFGVQLEQNSTKIAIQEEDQILKNFKPCDVDDPSCTDYQRAGLLDPFISQ